MEQQHPKKKKKRNVVKQRQRQQQYQRSIMRRHHDDHSSPLRLLLPLLRIKRISGISNSGLSPSQLLLLFMALLSLLIIGIKDDNSSTRTMMVMSFPIPRQGFTRYKRHGFNNDINNNWIVQRSSILSQQQQQYNHHHHNTIFERRPTTTRLWGVATTPNSNDDDDTNSSSSKNIDNENATSPTTTASSGPTNLLSLVIDPYRAGARLRATLDAALSNLTSTTTSSSTASKDETVYYLDDRIRNAPTSSSSSSSSSIPLDFPPSYDDDQSPEVLVIGATGAVGRLVVQTLLHHSHHHHPSSSSSSSFRIRVLVRDLYSSTLNLLGGVADGGITYCQGDLNDEDSLEYAVTDVDKIIFCAGAPRGDERDWRERFEEFVDEIGGGGEEEDGGEGEEGRSVEEARRARKRREEGVRGGGDGGGIDWGTAETIMKIRAKLAEQVDYIGMQNLVRAYQNVRHADYGTSQAAKRSLFKFQDRPGDFDLFSLLGSEEETEEIDEERGSTTTTTTGTTTYRWMKNKFSHGVLTGFLSSSSSSSTAAVISGRLRSSSTTSLGLDLSRDFAGFIVRVCGDGNNYEMFVRTKDVEYVCEFETAAKTENQRRSLGNKSRNKFLSVRLPFSKFRFYEKRRGVAAGDDDEEEVNDGYDDDDGDSTISPFTGRDVRRIGFRFCADKNDDSGNGKTARNNSRRPFYLSLSYIKVYRAQIEPEFIYLSDARIPHDMTNVKILPDVKQLVVTSNNNNDNNGMKTTTTRNDEGTSYQLFDEEEVKRGMMTTDAMTRIKEETYYKYCGEQILKNSGLSYTIIRLAGYNESPSGESSHIRLIQTNEDGITAVSRADVANVCVRCLDDPNAANTCFYVSKTATSSEMDDNHQRGQGETLSMSSSSLSSIDDDDDDISAKLAQLKSDS